MTTVQVPGGRPFDLLGVGECMVEFHARDPLGQATSFTRSYGGDVLNALVGAARLGSKAAFVTRVGNDPFGAGLLDAWRREGVDVTHAPLVDGENGVYFISLLPGGEREFTYRRRGSAASGLSERDVSREAVASSRAVLLSGITQAISPGARAATLHAARSARSAGTLVAFDPNHRPNLWAATGGLTAARAAFEELLPFVDVLLPSFPADTALLECRVTNDEAAARAFARSGVTVALKAGERGAWLCVNGGVTRVPAERDALVVDTTGAGDAWNGAFLHAILTGRPAEWASRFANAAAARKLRHRGAIPPLEATLSSPSIHFPERSS